MKLYKDDGYINWDYIVSQTRAFCMVTGARGTGKTYGLLKYMVQNRIKFIYLRRLKTQLEECANVDSNPFKKLNADCGFNIQPARAGNNVRFYRMVLEGDKLVPEGDPVCIGLALSTFASVRGADFSDINAIVFDEAISMIGEKPIKDEFKAFLNFYETVNRNRELSGGAPVQAFLLGNANKLGNPYYTGWGFMGTALRMIRGNQMMYRTADGSRIMIMLLNSPISEKKADTALYQNSSDDFITMALDNAFRTDETNIGSKPLMEYNYICSVGEVGVYKHKERLELYVSKSARNENYYDGFGMSLRIWQKSYALFQYYYYNKRILFESYDVELIFREYLIGC